VEGALRAIAKETHRSGGQPCAGGQLRRRRAGGDLRPSQRLAGVQHDEVRRRHGLVLPDQPPVPIGVQARVPVGPHAPQPPQRHVVHGVRRLVARHLLSCELITKW